MSQSEKPGLADIYRFLAQSMKFPDPAWLSDAYLFSLRVMLRELGGKKELEALAGLGPGGDSLTTLQAEHTRLFISAAPSVVAPPYGSVYMSSDGSLGNDFSEKVRLFYWGAGFELSEPGGLPDSLVHQLEFLALLAQKGKSEAEEEFLATCLRPWLPMFMARIMAGAEHPFYKTVVKLIDFFTTPDP